MAVYKWKKLENRHIVLRRTFSFGWQSEIFLIPQELEILFIALFYDIITTAAAAAAAKSLQSCPTLCDPIDGSPPGSRIPGILQARTLEWVAISFSSAWKWKVKVKPLSRVRPSATPWTAAFQAPPSMGFSRQEYWSGVPLPSSSKTARCDKYVFYVCILFKLHFN